MTQAWKFASVLWICDWFVSCHWFWKMYENQFGYTVLTVWSRHDLSLTTQFSEHVLFSNQGATKVRSRTEQLKNVWEVCTSDDAADSSARPRVFSPNNPPISRHRVELYQSKWRSHEQRKFVFDAKAALSRKHFHRRQRLKKNLANKIFGYLVRCDFWVKLELRFWILVGYVYCLTKFGAKSDFRV